MKDLIIKKPLIALMLMTALIFGCSVSEPDQEAIKKINEDFSDSPSAAGEKRHVVKVTKDGVTSYSWATANDPRQAIAHDRARQVHILHIHATAARVHGQV